MTESSTGTGVPSGPPLDRRWFEEALRAQGFVVEPPPVDVEPRIPEPPAAPAVRAAGAPAEPPNDPSPVDRPAGDAPSAGERPPVPSELLARIAARGRAGPAAAEAPDVAGPWTDAVLATVAPWAISGDEASQAPIAPPPERDLGPRAPSQGVVQPERSGGGDPAPAERQPDRPVATVTGQPGEPGPPADGDGHAHPDVRAALESPYVPAVADVAGTTDRAPAPALVVPPGPDASEGELWALVGGSDASATQASGSGPVRVLLTILTALLILVIVVGALVLASQLA